MLLVDKGTDIISYVDKKSDTDFIWTNPMGLSCLDKRRKAIMDDECYSDNYLGGMFEIIPNFGPACRYGEMHFTQNSEVSLLPWDYQVVEDSAQKIVFKFTVKLSKLPLMLSKTLTITNDLKALCFEEELLNIGAMPVSYLWSQHPCIGAPFLDENCSFELPFTENFDMPKAGSNIGMFEVYDCKNVNYAAIRNKKSGMGIGFSYDSDTYSHCAVWISADENKGHHKWNGAYVASILPCTSKTPVLSEAVKDNSADVINPDEVKKSWYTMTIFSKNTPVNKINKKGEVE